MKKLFALIGITLCLGLGTCLTSHYSNVQIAFAEESETTEVLTEEESEEIIEDEVSEEVVEEPTFYETLSQTAKDCIGVVKEVLNQPIVVAGVSTTLGAIVLLVISKLIGAITSKKEKEKVVSIVKGLESLLDRKDLSINELKSELGAFIQVIRLLVNNLKNVNVKNECLALLEKLDPIKESAKTFVESEKDLVVKDTKEEIRKDTETLLDILNK